MDAPLELELSDEESLPELELGPLSLVLSDFLVSVVFSVMSWSRDHVNSAVFIIPGQERKANFQTLMVVTWCDRPLDVLLKKAGLEGRGGNAAIDYEFGTRDES